MTIRLKHHFWKLLFFLLAPALFAQTNAPVRLAIVPETPEAASVADVLTVEFSKNSQVQLLERAQIEKVYREQVLSAGNRDYLKLGQILGADGLLLVDRGKEAEKNPTRKNGLNIRLVAVKPGVVLTAETVADPTKATLEWASTYARQMQPLLPKLTVLAKDAVPISVVDMRSAVSSVDAPEIERALRTLAIQRLSHEPRLFVLERQQMQSLAGEKQFNADETTFWNGAWLLDGVVDQNGYARDTITINARLRPAKGGTPLSLEVSGSRTNLAQAINTLATRVIAALELTPAVTEWNPSDEAGQFLAEANWALAWGAMQQAQAAADAAWALGGRDLDCANIRIKARTGQIPMLVPTNMAVFVNGRSANVVHINEPPNARNADLASQALASYLEFCRTSAAAGTNLFSSRSEWYALGIDILGTASQVLQHFQYALAGGEPVPEKLAELRAEARMVAKSLYEVPSIHDSYFVGNRIATRDELYNSIEDRPNIFSCMLTWGCFWQERPDDTLGLYHQLLESPVFCYIHNDLWQHSNPRLIGWNQKDRQRIPDLWADFVRQLNLSTNLLWRLEAKALTLADIHDGRQLGLAFTNF
ncbi:MAG TPA: hypothetical protein VF988_05450, partial [Verrucomicrobiae bacterium]